MAKRDRFDTPDPRQGGLGAVAYRPDDADDPQQAAAEAVLFGIEGVRGVGAGRDPTGAAAWICYVVDRAAAARLPRSVAGRPVIAEVSGEIDAQPR